MISLRRHDHIIKRPQIQAERFPSIEMRAGVYTPTRPLRLPYRPILLKGLCALDTGRVGAGCGVDVVGAAVCGDGAAKGTAGARVIGAVGFDDIEFDQGVGGPAVDGEVGVSVGGVGATEGDGSRGCRVREGLRQMLGKGFEIGFRIRGGVIGGALPGTTWVPALTADEVALVAGPAYSVAATVVVVISDRAGAIGPKRIVVASTCARRTWGTCSCEEKFTAAGICSVDDRGEFNGREGRNSCHG